MMLGRIIGQRQFWTKTKQTFGTYDIVQPGHVSARKSVPKHIAAPKYYETGVPTVGPDVAEIKDDGQIERMRDSCKLAAKILKIVEKHLKVGMTTDEIDTIVHDATIKADAYPSPLNYKHFPKSVCTSVNNVACHGIPDSRQLQNGDIVNVDITVYLHGYHGDCSKTFLIGDEVDAAGRDLVTATEHCMRTGIAACRAGAYFRSIGAAIEQTAHNLGYNVVPCFIGHGIGSYFHGAPDICHFMNNEPGRMREGMTFTIEPVLTQGGCEIEILEDGWTAVTCDGARTAQFEHTVLVTGNGSEILTI